VAPINTPVTYKSDVAFWLHLASAPLITHPIFGMLGVLDGNETQEAPDWAKNLEVSCSS
jgi:hypothetical protein